MTETRILRLGIRILRVWKGRRGPASSDLPGGAAFPDFQGDAGVEEDKDNLSGDKVAYARDGFTERAQNDQSVSMRSPVGAPDSRSVGNVLAEKRREVWAVVGKFGFTPGLFAVTASLLGVRDADREVEGGVRVAWGGGKDVGGSGVSARNEAGNPSLCSTITGLGRSMHKCGDRAVATCGLAQGATGGVGGACLQRSRLAGGTGHRFTGSGAAQAQARRVNVLFGLQHTSMRRHIHVRSTSASPSSSSRASAPPRRSPHARAPEAAPDGRPCRVPERWRGQILHDVLGPTEHVAPEELSLSQGFVMLTKQGLCRLRRKGGDEARKGCTGARVVLGHDGLARGVKGKAKVIDHGGDQRAAHDAAGNEGRKRGPERRSYAQPVADDARGGLPPGVIRQVATERGAHGGSQLPIKSSQQVVIKQVSVDVHVIHELGHVSTLPGEDHPSGSVMCSREPNADPSAVVPESGLGTSTVSCTYGVSHPSNSVLRSGGQSRRAELLTLPCAAHPRGPKGGNGGVQGPQQKVKREGSDTHLSVVNKPFVTDALGVEGVGDELSKRRVASTSPCSAPRLVAKVAPVGREGDGLSLALPLGLGRGFQKMRAESLADTRPLGVAEHVDKIQVGRPTNGSSVPFATIGSMVPRQWQSPSRAPSRLMPHWCIRRALERRMT